MKKIKNKPARFLIILLAFVLAFKVFDFTAGELTDRKAYEDAAAADSGAFQEVLSKAQSGEVLSEEDYGVIFSQSGLGKPAADKLISENNTEKIEFYRDYFLLDKDCECIREGIFACHERITDAEKNPIENPYFADLQDGDILITLSIHSLGWRHGHAAVVIDAEAGKTVQATMWGEKTSIGSVREWLEYPLVAVLRAKNTDEYTRKEIARYAGENLVGLRYSFAAGLVGSGSSAGTQCAHLVELAYNEYAIDIDSNGGKIITPYQILKSENLETVQVYGNIKEL